MSRKPGPASGATILSAAILCATIAAALLVSCREATQTPDTTGAHLQLSFGAAEARALSRAAADSTVGDSGTAGLTSLKYYVASIVLYSDITPTGSGFAVDASASQWWVTTADSTSWQPSQDFDATANATGFVDLLSPTDRERLSQNVQIPETSVGTWNWIVIQVAPVVKITGSADMGNGTTLYTHAGTAANATLSTGASVPILASATPLDQGPADEAVFSASELGGGLYYRLQKPLVVTQADIDAGTTFTLQVVVETEGLLQAWLAGTTNTFADHSGAGYFLGYDTSGNGAGTWGQIVFAPPLHAVPILVAAGEAVAREQYRIGYAGTVDTDGVLYDVANDILLTFYTDATGSILGLDLHGVVGSAHHGVSPREFVPLWRFATPYAYSIDAAGAVTLTDFLGDPIVQGLVRLGAQGDAGTTMPGLVTGHPASLAPAPVSATSYSLVSLGTL